MVILLIIRPFTWNNIIIESYIFLSKMTQYIGTFRSYEILLH